MMTKAVRNTQLWLRNYLCCSESPFLEKTSGNILNLVFGLDSLSK